jgi:hypothetical protein
MTWNEDRRDATTPARKMLLMSSRDELWTEKIRQGPFEPFSGPCRRASVRRRLQFQGERSSVRSLRAYQCRAIPPSECGRKKGAESAFEDDACPACNCHFAGTLANFASDSARCSRTASTVKHEIRIPSVVLVLGELNSTTDSILFGIPFRMPTYLPPPAATIDANSISPGSRAGPMSIHQSRRCMESSILFQTASLWSLFHEICFGSLRTNGMTHIFSVLSAGDRRWQPKERRFSPQRKSL